eukprot:TRINITY_DN3105_c0_g2_i1.p1 TRINITY_DN3105_c0_g2~~TRINITY_DN3105_c0_g2_i1.p1  ORF type:complete len:262 (-),score=67.55 TRINITY_DN3105_c0_g2_i1:213-998(-)
MQCLIQKYDHNIIIHFATQKKYIYTYASNLLMSYNLLNKLKQIKNYNNTYKQRHTQLYIKTFFILRNMALKKRVQKDKFNDYSNQYMIKKQKNQDVNQQRFQYFQKEDTVTETNPSMVPDQKEPSQSENQFIKHSEESEEGERAKQRDENQTEEVDDDDDDNKNNNEEEEDDDDEEEEEVDLVYEKYNGFNSSTNNKKDQTNILKKKYSQPLPLNKQQSDEYRYLMMRQNPLLQYKGKQKPKEQNRQQQEDEFDKPDYLQE